MEINKVMGWITICLGINLGSVMINQIGVSYPLSVGISSILLNCGLGMILHLKNSQE